MKLELLNQWMKIHGVDPKGPVQVFQLNTISQKGMASGYVADLPVREIGIAEVVTSAASA